MIEILTGIKNWCVAKLDGKAASSHTHGNVTNDGKIASTEVTSATGVLVYDSNNKIQRATAGQARGIIGAAGSVEFTQLATTVALLVSANQQLQAQITTMQEGMGPLTSEYIAEHNQWEDALMWTDSAQWPDGNYMSLSAVKAVMMVNGWTDSLVWSDNLQWPED